MPSALWATQGHEIRSLEIPKRAEDGDALERATTHELLVATEVRGDHDDCKAERWSA